MFEEGDLVLIRTPDMLGKLEDIWEVPFEVTKRVNECTYEVAVPGGRRSGKRCVHVNMVKDWKQGVASICRIVVADDSVEDMKEGQLLGKSELTETQ